MKPRNRQISHLTEIKSKSSDGRQMIYGNRQIPSPFNRDWNGKVYATKEVRPIFIEQADEIVVVTVYTYNS